MRRKKTGIRLYLCAFFLPFLICILICVRNRVYPFGETCILHVDMYHQYAPFFTEFMDKLKHGGSLLYSFRLGIGSDFVSLFAYYLASPFNWLLLLCPSGSGENRSVRSVFCRLSAASFSDGRWKHCFVFVILRAVGLYGGL